MDANPIKILEENAQGAPVKDVLWEAHQAQTEGFPIIDPGVGKETVLRFFFFKAMPGIKATRHEIFSQFKRMIEMNLWGDGLIPRDEKAIEFHTKSSAKKVSKSLYQKMKQENADYVILVLAQPRAGVTVTDKPFQAK